MSQDSFFEKALRELSKNLPESGDIPFGIFAESVKTGEA
jgi:hypothetical protein